MDAGLAGEAGAGSRWLMLTPPGGGPDITLVSWFAGSSPPGSAKLSIGCDDVDATYAEPAARGVKPNNEVQDATWGRWFGIDDPDGNNWLIVQARLELSHRRQVRMLLVGSGPRRFRSSPVQDEELGRSPTAPRSSAGPTGQASRPGAARTALTRSSDPPTRVESKSISVPTHQERSASLHAYLLSMLPSSTDSSWASVPRLSPRYTPANSSRSRATTAA
jgi:hypothetical protein